MSGPRLTAAEHLFLQVFEAMAGKGGVLDLGLKDSAARAAICRDYGLSRPYISSMLTKLAQQGALVRVKPGHWRVRIPSARCGHTPGRKGRKFTRFTRSPNPDPRGEQQAEPPVVEWAAKPVPKDTRDLTGRLMGDPMPGRSALDRMRELSHA